MKVKLRKKTELAEAPLKPTGKISTAIDKLEQKMDALVDGRPEGEYLPPWEKVDEGDYQRKAQVRALRTLVNSGTVAAACRSAGVSRKTFNAWLETEEFKEAFNLATEDMVDDLEEIAILRAKIGSDPLMVMALKALRPEKYGDKKRVVHSGDRDNPIGVEVLLGARVRLGNEIKKLASREEYQLSGTVEEPAP